MMKKFPPIEKILEAYTAIADGHVKLENDQALVTSSNEAKTYTVTLSRQYLYFKLILARLSWLFRNCCPDASRKVTL